MAVRMIGSTRLNLLSILLVTLVICFGTTGAIRCYKCGQYNDGVGSITPCINYTAHMHLEECPPSAEWCIIELQPNSKVFVREGELEFIKCWKRRPSEMVRRLMLYLVGAKALKTMTAKGSKGRKAVPKRIMDAVKCEVKNRPPRWHRAGRITRQRYRQRQIFRALLDIARTAEFDEAPHRPQQP